MKILYSINGDGMGHTTRSIPIIEALSKNHKVKVIVGSKRSYNFVKRKFKDVTYIEGLALVYRDNTVDRLETAKYNFDIMFRNKKSFSKVYNTLKKFKPDVSMTDCEHLTIFISKMLRYPVICTCNVHAMTEMKYSVPKKYKRSYYTAKFIIKALDSNIDYHLISTFFSAPLKRPKITFIFPPILRKEVYTLKPERKDYYLVYQTSNTNNRLISTLKKTKAKFIVYGFDTEGSDGNIQFKSFNSEEFFADFKNCRAVIANGGYSFISEAVSLRKPVLAVPIKNQFEQTLNALQIKRLGYGEMCDSITPNILEKFIKNNDKYYENLKGYKKEDNKRVLKKIDEILAKIHREKKR